MCHVSFSPFSVPQATVAALAYILRFGVVIVVNVVSGLHLRVQTVVRLLGGGRIVAYLVVPYRVGQLIAPVPCVQFLLEDGNKNKKKKKNSKKRWMSPGTSLVKNSAEERTTSRDGKRTR